MRLNINLRTSVNASFANGLLEMLASSNDSHRSAMLSITFWSSAVSFKKGHCFNVVRKRMRALRK